MRHVSALTIMLTGDAARPCVGDEPRIGASFQLTSGEQALVMASTMKTGGEQICLAFDVDDASGAAVGLGLFRREGDEVAVCCKCQLWSPPIGGRAAIVSGQSGEHGHFLFEAGMPLVHVRSLPPDDLNEGCRRGVARIKPLVESRELRDAPSKGIMHVISNDGRKLFAISRGLGE